MVGLDLEITVITEAENSVGRTKYMKSNIVGWPNSEEWTTIEKHKQIGEKQVFGDRVRQVDDS